MDRRVVALGLIVLLGSGCGAAGSVSSNPVSSAPSPSSSASATTVPSPTDEPASATPNAAGIVILLGSFTGHHEDTLATADQTVTVEVRWNAGPEDIHDRNAFTFTSGSFTFSESIGGVCGGSRTEAGSMTSPINPQSMISGSDPQGRDIAQVGMTDHRLSGSGLEFSLASTYEVPNGDNEGCGDLDRFGVGSCPLVFLQTAIGALQTEATCSGAGGTWTGQLVPQG